MMAFPIYTDIDDVAAVQSEEVDADSPVGSDIAIRWAKACNSYYEHLADFPIDESVTQSVTGHSHARGATDSEYVRRLNFISMGCVYANFLSISAGSPRIVTLSPLSNYILSAVGQKVTASSTFSFSGVSVLLNRDLKYLVSPEFGISSSAAGTVLELSMLVYDSTLTLIDSASDTVENTSKDTRIVVPLSDVSEYDDWVYIQINAEVTGAGTGSVVCRDVYRDGTGNEYPQNVMYAYGT